MKNSWTSCKAIVDTYRTTKGESYYCLQQEDGNYLIYAAPNCNALFMSVKDRDFRKYFVLV